MCSCYFVLGHKDIMFILFYQIFFINIIKKLSIPKGENKIVWHTYSYHKDTTLFVKTMLKVFDHAKQV